MDKPRVLVGLAVTADVMEIIAESCDVVAAFDAQQATEAELDSAFSRVQGALIPSTLPIPNSYFDRYPKLRVLSNVAVGYDNVDIPYATSKGVLICNTPGVLDGAVADTVMALIISLARGILRADSHVRSGAWSEGRELPPGIDVRGKTLGIIGMGRIGRTVATTARAFAMRVIYYDTLRSIDSENAGIAAYCERDKVFRESDFVTVHVFLNNSTRHSIGRREFQLMKGGAYFINTSRGAVVRQEELVEALVGGEIGGAGLDVMESEPLRPDDPLCYAPNTILLPHIGSATVETRKRMFHLAARNLVAAVMGNIPEAAVNPEVLAAQE